VVPSLRSPHDRSSWRWLRKSGAGLSRAVGFLVLLIAAKELSRRAAAQRGAIRSANG
jgi:hypothetical protein